MKKGFTLVETLIGVFIFTLLSLAIYQGYLSILDLARLARLKSLGVLVANQQLELAHNLTYDNVGILNGIPSGAIPRDQTVTSGGMDFQITTTVRNIDDPFDGTIGGNPNDLSPADYKLVSVLVTCASCKNFTPLEVTTTIAPKNLETATGNGALFVQVIDASGIIIPDAEVHIENNQVNPGIVIDETTNEQGLLQLVDVPPGNFAYEITVTKDGYSTAQTYLIDPNTNPNPLPPHSTVLAGQVTQISFAIDLVGEFDLKTLTSLCVPVPSIPFNLRGEQTIGANPTVYKYDQDFTTNASGERVVGDLEVDTYNLTQTATNYDLAGTMPLLPLEITPGGTQNVSLIMAPKNPKALLVIVKDGVTGLPLSEATVNLTKTGFSESLLTDRGFFRQTDWVGGGGQTDFLDPSKFFAVDIQNNADHSSQPGEVKLKLVGSDYQGPGWLESSIFDTGGTQTTYYNLGWTPANQPVDTGVDSLQFQIASATSTSNPFPYLGPDGTASSFYSLADTNINPIHQDERFVRYKLFMNTASSTLTPSLSEVSLTFGSECLPFGQVFFSGLATGIYNLEVIRNGYQTYQNDSLSVVADWQLLEISLNP